MFFFFIYRTAPEWEALDKCRIPDHWKDFNVSVVCFALQVMLLANPSIEELYHKSCALAEDPQEVKDSFQHPARLIKVPHKLSFVFFVHVSWQWCHNPIPFLSTHNVEMSYLRLAVLYKASDSVIWTYCWLLFLSLCPCPSLLPPILHTHNPYCHHPPYSI